MAVVKNKVIDHWRRLERRERKLHLVWAGDGAQPDPYERVFAAADRQKVVEVLERLSERHRLLLMLHYVDGHSARELAEISGGTSVAVESALARARRAFRGHWSDLEAGSG
jgi:RNA polymerase sigma-70 factor (ECF subfamily)